MRWHLDGGAKPSSDSSLVRGTPRYTPLATDPEALVARGSQPEATPLRRQRQMSFAFLFKSLRNITARCGSLWTCGIVAILGSRFDQSG
jgi:hypothetical protein